MKGWLRCYSATISQGPSRPDALRKSVERGKLFGVPTCRWIAGRQRLKTTWVVFLAEIAPGFAGVEDARVEPGPIAVLPAHNRVPSRD